MGYGMSQKKDFFLRVREAFSLYKRELSLFLLFCAISVDLLPNELVEGVFGESVAEKFQISCIYK